MCSDDKYFVCGWTGHFGHYCPDALCYGCDEFGHFAQDLPNKIPLSGTPHHSRDLIQGINTPTTRGMGHTPIMIPHIGTITADQSPTQFTLQQKQQL